MAIKPFNSVGGYSVGPNLTPFLDADNNATVANLTVEGNVSGNIASLSLTGDLTVDGISNLESLNVNAAAVFDSTVSVGNVLTVTGNIVADGALLDVAGNVEIAGTANVTGILKAIANIDGGANLNLTNNAVIGGKLDVTGDTTLQAANIQGLLGVEGESVFSNLATFTGDLVSQSQLTVNGNTLFNGGPSGNIVIDETDLTSNGNVILSGPNVSLGTVANLHIGGGNAAQYLQTDGTGNLVWSSVDTDTLANGTSNVDIPVADGPVRVGVGGTGNVAVFTTTGLDVTSNITATDTVTANSFVANTGANIGSLTVRDNAELLGELIVDGATEISNTLTVTSWANVTGDIVGGANLELTGDANIGGDLTVAGAATFNGATVDINNSAVTLSNTSLSSNGTVSFTGSNVSLGAVGNLHITGGLDGQILKTDGNGNVSWSSTANISAIVNGTSTVDIPVADGDVFINVGGTQMAQFAANANITLDSNVYLNGFLSLQDTLGVGGTSALEGDLTVGSAGGAQSNATVYGNITGNLNLSIVGDANVAGSLRTNDITVTGAGAEGANIDGTGQGIQLFDTSFVQLNYNDTNKLYVNTGGLTVDFTGANVTTADTNGDWSFGNNVSIAANIDFVDGAATSLDLTGALTTANLTANGNVTLGAVANVHITGGSTGQILSTDGAGNLSWTSTANISQIVNGTSKVSIPVADGNVYVDVNGQANVITVQSNGTFATTTITDDVLITGNLIINGTQTDINVTNLNVEDPVITEGRGPNNTALTTNDGLDRGLYSYRYDVGTSTEKGSFVGYKNAGTFAGKYILASDATLANNVASVNSYADVVVSSIVSGADTTGDTNIAMGASIDVNVNGAASVLSISDTAVTANVGLAVNNGNIAVTGGSTGAYGSELTLAATDGSGSTVTTLGSGFVGTASSTPTPIVTIPDAIGRTVEFFISARDTINGNFEGAKYLVVSDGAGVVESTAYGTVRIGTQTQQVEVTFASIGSGTDIEARVAVLDNTSFTAFSTQYQIVG